MSRNQFLEDLSAFTVGGDASHLNLLPQESSTTRKVPIGIVYSELHFPLAKMLEDRYEKKGTETKWKNRILPQDENDMLSEKTQERIIDLKVRLCSESCNNQLKKILKTRVRHYVTTN
ncbi:uncharacterized protein LOC116137870 isoform X2 [Pistacia vera]|uniref:uncharacterized protein LOC116137870 isoform X2 n=1 Tax=Pistacia vera TaxID=55513 RepID=UPI001263437F|nr:uncharacterized protein LOC116137870 isoform X2 [Pistacia vera]